MKNKHLLMGGGAVLSVAVAALLIHPVSRRTIILGLLRQEPTNNERYMSEWAEDLSSADEDARFKAAINLHTMGGGATKALPDLARLMNEDNSLRVRAGASFAIYKIVSAVNHDGGHTPEVLDALIRGLEDSDGIVRMNAALALGTMKADARGAVPALIEGLKRKENQRMVLTFTMMISEQMIADLGSIGPEAKDAVGALEEAFQDDNDSVREFAARALGRIGPDAKHALNLLVKAAEDKSERKDVKDAAHEAIRLIDPPTAEKLSQE